MRNDDKLGLAVGVSLVILVAVVYFRKESGPPPADPAATITRPEGEAVGLERPSPPPPARTIARPSGAAPALLASRRHTVEAGDTLFGLAVRYYGDGDRFGDIYRANRGVLKTPDELPVGVELVL